MVMVCRGCGMEKPLEAYRPKRRKCRECDRVAQAERYADDPNKYREITYRSRRKNPQKYRDRRVWSERTYGLTAKQVEEMAHRQNHQCLICGDTFRAGTHGRHIDHDHVTGHVRGLLCAGCNQKLGHWEWFKMYETTIQRYLGEL